MNEIARLSARPKVLLATNYEEALDLFDRYCTPRSLTQHTLPPLRVPP